MRAGGVTHPTSAIRESIKLLVEVVPDIQAGHVNSLRSFNLEEADIKKVFSAFGESEIAVYQAGSVSPMENTQTYGSHAIVNFECALSALTAQQFLNNQYLAKYKALLSVKLLVESHGNRRTPMQDGLLDSALAKNSMVKIRSNSAGPFSRQQESRLHRKMRMQQEEMYGGRNVRYTCRFEIAIANDEEFRVVRRLRGANGCNMIRIKEMCGRCEER